MNRRTIITPLTLAVAAVAAAALALVLVVVALPATAHADTTTATSSTIPELRRADRRAHIGWASYRLHRCAVEDSRNCRWLAYKRGNGRGKSWIDLNGRTITWDPFALRARALPYRSHVLWAAARLRPCPRPDARNCVYDSTTRPTDRGMSWIDLNGVDYLFHP